MLARGRIPALDWLRALAILFVLFAHASGELPHGFRRLASAGWCGVDLFFVLSGFLITKGLILTKESPDYFSSFYRRRFLRIFPVYYLSLAVLFLVLPLSTSFLPLPDHHDQFFFVVYLNNWSVFLHAMPMQMVGHFWSLAVEEQFYCVWPILVLACSRRQLLYLALASILLAPCLRAYLFQHHTDFESIYRNTFCRLDSLMGGVICALAATRRRTSRTPVNPRFALWAGYLLAASVPVLIGTQYFRPPVLIFGILVYAIAFSLLVYGYTEQPANNRLFSSMAVQSLASWSYGIYVYHLPIYYLASRYHLASEGTLVAIEIAASVILAAVSFRYFEQPILRLRLRFESLQQSTSALL